MNGSWHAEVATIIKNGGDVSDCFFIKFTA